MEGALKLAQFLAQQDAFDVLDKHFEAWMRMFYNDSGTRAASAQDIAERLGFFAQEARKVSSQSGLDLDLPAVRAEDLQALAAQKGKKVEKDNQGNLFQPGGARLRESSTTGRTEAGRQVSGESREGLGGKSNRLDQGRGADSAPAEKAVEPSDKPTTIQDAGEKIGGARKVREGKNGPDTALFSIGKKGNEIRSVGLPKDTVAISLMSMTSHLKVMLITETQRRETLRRPFGSSPILLSQTQSSVPKHLAQM